MKQMTQQMLVALIFMCTGYCATAQNTANISTGGYDFASDTRLYWPSLEPNWKVKIPGGAYQSMQISTGYDWNIQIPYQNINSAAGWLTPYYQTSDGPIQPPATDPLWHGGDLNPINTTFTDSVFIYRMPFTVSYPSCQRPVTLGLEVYTMTGMGRVDDILINGHPIGSLNPLSAYHFNISPNYGVFPQSEQAGPVLWATPTPQNPTLPPPVLYYEVSNLNPAVLVNGTNYLYVKVVQRPLSGNEGAAFMCKGNLKYTFGYDYPVLNITSAGGCTNPTMTYQVNSLHSSSTTYTVKVYAGSSSSPFYTNSSVNPNTPVTISNLSTGNYKVVATDNGGGCTLSSTTRYHSIYGCSVSTFTPSNMWQGRNLYPQTCTPDNMDEFSLTDFEYKWKLEELDPVTFDPIYTIDNPLCWQTKDGICNFAGFNPDNSYSGNVDVTDFGGSNPDPGAFFGDRIYRITRSTRHHGTDWEEYNVVMGDDLSDPEDMGDNGIAGSSPVVSKHNIMSTNASVKKLLMAGQNEGLIIYPNPANGVLNVSLTSNQPKTVQVFDMVGHLVFEKQQVTDQVTTIDLTNESKGVYLVQVKYGNTVKMEKIIKQ